MCAAAGKWEQSSLVSLKKRKRGRKKWLKQRRRGGGKNYILHAHIVLPRFKKYRGNRALICTVSWIMHGRAPRSRRVTPKLPTWCDFSFEKSRSVPTRNLVVGLSGFSRLSYKRRWRKTRPQVAFEGRQQASQSKVQTSAAVDAHVTVRHTTYCARGKKTEPIQWVSASSPALRWGSVWVSGWVTAAADSGTGEWAIVCRDFSWVSLLSFCPPALNATGLLYLPPPACRLKIDPRRGSDVISCTGEWSTLETPRPVGFLSLFFFPVAQTRLCALSCLGNPSAIKRESIHFYDFRISLSVSIQVRVCKSVLDPPRLSAEKYLVFYWLQHKVVPSRLRKLDSAWTQITLKEIFNIPDRLTKKIHCVDFHFLQINLLST